MSKRTFDDPHGKSDAARQALLDNRAEHKPKNHRTLKRRKAIEKAKRLTAQHNRGIAKKRWKKFQDQARAYWQGEDVGYPAKPSR